LCRFLLNFLLIIVLLPVWSTGAKAAEPVIFVEAKKLGPLQEIPLLDSVCYFHPGRWRQGIGPTETKGWSVLHFTGFGGANAPKGWAGIGCFAYWLRVDSALVNQKLAFRINHDGASQVYLDGRAIGGYGKVGNNAREMEAVRAPRDIIPIWFSDTKPHLIVIYYANFKAVFPDFYGFQVNLGRHSYVAERMNRSNQLLDMVPWFAVGQLILGLLQFFFFLFYPRQSALMVFFMMKV